MNLSERLEELRKVHKAGSDKFLDFFIPSVTPVYSRPKHLAVVVSVIEDAIAGIPQRVVIHTPPRHAKTETLLHGIAFGLKKKPGLVFGYASYSTPISYSKSRVARAVAKRANVELEMEAVKEWRTTQGGGCLATSIGGELTGHGINVMIVDDPVKNRVEAESARIRDRNYDWFKDVVMTRIEPGGSVIVNATRWHPDDLMGRLIKEGWRYIRLPAINDDNTTLWPERWPLDALLERKREVGTYTWESLYQGNPRSRGGAVFGDAWCFELLPREYRAGIGVDLAYSSKTSADYSVCITMLAAGGFFYVVDMQRAQVSAPQFAETLKRARQHHPNARMRWYSAGTEKGVGDFIRPMLKGIGFETPPPRGDKFTRAINYAAAWNAGKVLVPEDADANPWVNDFLTEHASFTGVNDEHDDIVDAAVAAFDVLAGGPTYSESDDEVNFGRRM